MKRAVILHGTNGNPDSIWLPWLKKQLEANGYSVFAPLLPENHTPNKEIYDKFLKESNWDFEDNILVGHSSGATTVLNLISSDWFPKIKAAVLVGVFLNEKLLGEKIEWYKKGQFDGLFTVKFDPSKLKQKCQHFYFIHGDNDPFCDIADAKELCSKVGGKFVEVPNGLHLSASSGRFELPEAIELLKQDNLI